MNVSDCIDCSLNLSPRRLLHSRGVAQMAIALNERYGLGYEKGELYQMGLCHDLAREWDTLALVKAVHEHGIEVSEEELQSPVLLHAPVAAYLLSGSGLGDEALTAIRHHSLGSTAMGVMGALLYCSDYLEINRTHLTEHERVRLLGEPTIEALTLAIVECDRTWRRGQGLPVALASDELYHDLLKRLRS